MSTLPMARDMVRDASQYLEGVAAGMQSIGGGNDFLSRRLVVVAGRLAEAEELIRDAVAPKPWKASGEPMMKAPDVEAEIREILASSFPGPARDDEYPPVPPLPIPIRDLPKSVRVEVNPDDIDGGFPKSACRCPVANALHREFPDAVGGEISVIPPVAFAFHGAYRLPREAVDWIARFDEGKAVGPVAFDVSLDPAEDF